MLRGDGKAEEEKECGRVKSSQGTPAKLTCCIQPPHEEDDGREGYVVEPAPGWGSRHAKEKEKAEKGQEKEVGTKNGIVTKRSASIAKKNQNINKRNDGVDEQESAELPHLQGTRQGDEFDHVAAPVIAYLKGVIVLEKKSESAIGETGPTGLQDEGADNQGEGPGKACEERG